METLDMGHHISKRYNEELEDIRNRVLAMGGMLEQQLQGAMASLENQDERLAKDEVPDFLWRRLAPADADKDGAVTVDELRNRRRGP